MKQARAGKTADGLAKGTLAPDAPSSTGFELVQLDRLELTYTASTREQDALKRRFMKLTVPKGASSGLRGGVGYVKKAESVGARGVFFALKRLNAPIAEGAAAGDPQAQLSEASFRREYDTQLLLSPTGLVPKIYGYARIGGEPAILMEWVEGLTLREAVPQLRGADGRVPPRVVSDIGMSVLAALHRIERVDPGLVHRDLSPGNIMIRTGARSLADQMASGMYDICLIDFGSATLEPGTCGSFTMTESYWRGATPVYAPPEMLDRDSAENVGLRYSHAIDVYALCSVLYELYAGQTPYETFSRAEHAVFEMKTSEPPRPVSPREGDDGSLAGIILGGLAPEQEKRPTVESLMRELQGWEESRGASRPWAQTLAERTASDKTATAKASGSLSPTVLTLPTAPRAAGPETNVHPGRRTLSRRALIGAGAAALAAVLVAAAGSQTRWFGLRGPAPKQSVNDYSWEELSAISRLIAGAADGSEAARIEAEYHLVNGDGLLDGTQAKDVTLADGTQASVVITGFCRDERSDGSGKAGIAFAFSAPVAKRAMESERFEARWWVYTKIRTWLSQDFARLLPDDLAQVLVEVEKQSLALRPAKRADAGLDGTDYAGEDLHFAASLLPTSDRLWLYAGEEIEGFDANEDEALGLAEGEGAARQYELFANYQAKRRTSMFSGSCWLRTPSVDSRYGYDFVDEDGVVLTYDENYEQDIDPRGKRGIVPGFCV